MKQKTLCKQIKHHFEKFIQSYAESDVFTVNELDTLFHIVNKFADLKLAGGDAGLKTFVWELILERVNEQLIKLKEKRDNEANYNVNKIEFYHSIRSIVESCNHRLIEIDLNSTSLIKLAEIYQVSKQLDRTID